MIQDAKIEVVRMHRFENDGPVKAFCDLQFDQDYIVKGFRIIDGKDGLFAGMPSEVGKTGRWFNTFVPLSDEVKGHITDVLIKAYEE